MSTRPVKHSLTLRGHRTSVSLEDAFWQAFREIAVLRGQPLNALAAEIDAARGSDTGLASAIRVFVLEHHRAMADAIGKDGGLSSLSNTRTGAAATKDTPSRSTS